MRNTFLFLFCILFAILMVAFLPSGNEKYKLYINSYKLSTGNFPDTLYHNEIFDVADLKLKAKKKIYPYSPVDYQLLNACIFYYTQLHREKLKKKLLQFHPLLRDAAAYHALQMSEKKFYSHENKTEKKMKTPQQRIFNFGVESEFSGENITKVFAINYIEGKPYEKDKNHFYYAPNINDTIPFHTYSSLAEKIVQSWINSPPHNKNMLLKDYTYLGCASVIEAASLENKKIPNILAVQNFAGNIH